MMLVIVLLMNSFPVTTQASTPSEEDGPEVGDVKDSGCTDKTRANSSRGLVLTKEGDIVTCEINGIVANCGVDYFDIKTEYAQGKDVPDSLFVDMTPVVRSTMDCTCPYNVSFTIRNVKSDSFYMYCFPFTGMVSFKESNQVTLEYSSKRVTIDGSQYYLYMPGQQARLYSLAHLGGEVRIPSTISNEGQNYTVASFNPEGFYGGEITKLYFPKTIRSMSEDFKNIFNARYPLLEAIEVEAGCPLLSSVDGVLYSADQKTLYCLPGANKRADYSVIEGVEKIGFYAFSSCPNLKTIRLSESVTTITPYAFGSSKNLEAIYIPGKLNRDGLNKAFLYMSSTPTLYVPDEEVEYYKTIYKGPVLPISTENETENDDYHPFVKEGKTWNYQEYYHNLWNDEQWTKDVSYVINGTKEIDGKTYYKMNRIIENVSEYCCALREENRKVWMYYDGGDHLLYDFGMSVGDSYNPLLSWESYCYQLTAIKPVQFHDNHLFNVLYYDIFEDPIDHDSYIASAPIVEGVGCEKGWNIMELYAEILPNGILQGENFLSCYEDGKCVFTADDFNRLTNPNPADNMTYRPFIEDDKVWKVGAEGSGNLVQWVKYYYFDGDTIIGGKTCKQMMCEQFVNPDYVDYDYVMRYPQLSYVGAWYEEDKKVYFYNANNKRFTLWYDFSADANDTIQILGQSYVIGSKQTGGMKGFKGVYRDVMMVWDEEQNNYNTTWLEGVGCIDGPTVGVYFGEENHTMFLMSCTVGDEVIYFNDEYEDGATPDEMNARKQRIDFTHTVKIRPKAPMKRAEEQSLYGEYNERQLGINLNPLDEAYLVRITDESGKTFYEKTVNAGSIVGLNIDISAYTKGRYIVTVENSQESFTGVFDAQTQGIEENVRVEKANNASIYNLHGQRISTLQKGLNIVNGQKVYVK